ncbi:MAG TPA: substrate-binding and VWA domain-containing protein [Streptosporangiaceae bacterium]|nr:substrate-binding and VWA domain-containing protein [Streptosporangiaceae bacterium]
MNQRARKGRVSRRGREHHISVKLLVAIAVGISAVLMATLAAQAVVARTSCNDHPLLVNVAVSQDVTPAVEQVAQLFNRENHEAAGQCVEVQVTQEQPAQAAATVEGQASTNGLPAADAWIPDSSLWVDIARGFPLGAQRIQTTGVSVAKSPLMLVMPANAAAQIPAFNDSVGWNFLLPSAAGGPSSAAQVSVSLPDPTQSAAGLASMIEMLRLLGTTPSGRDRMTKFVLKTQSSAEFDDPTTLASFALLGSKNVGGHPVTITTEQAVIGYDQAHPAQPLAALYPSGGRAALGDPELDYPYVVTSTSPAEIAGAQEFGKELQSSYMAGLVRFDGFRSANGVLASVPASYGLAQQQLQLATPASAGNAQTALTAWHKLETGSRDLALTDVSSSMRAPSGLGDLDLETLLTQTANLGLNLFPDSAQIGVWEFASKLNGNLPYKQLVSVGPLPGDLGLISRRQQIQQIDAGLSAQSNTPAALNDSILAGYQSMVDTYQPNFTNALLVLTAGVDNAPGDMPTKTLVSKLKALYNPSKPVELIILQLGSKGNFGNMQQIAKAGGGQAFAVTDTNQIDQVFFEAVSRRICQGGSCPS